MARWLIKNRDNFAFVNTSSKHTFSPIPQFCRLIFNSFAVQYHKYRLRCRAPGRNLRLLISPHYLHRPWRPIGLWDVEVPTFSLENRLIHGGMVVSLTRRSPFTLPGRFLVLISIRGLVEPRTTLQIEKFNDLIMDRSRDLPACSLLPQSTTLPRAPLFTHIQGNMDYIFIGNLISNPTQNMKFCACFLCFLLQL
jgi:hypothetical protein